MLIKLEASEEFSARRRVMTQGIHSPSLLS
jgi:hypothetical protein